MKGGCGVLHWQQSPTDSLTLSISLYHYNISDYHLLYDSILHKHTDQTHRHQITDTRSSTKENKLTCITCQEIEERITIRLKRYVHHLFNEIKNKNCNDADNAISSFALEFTPFSDFHMIVNSDTNMKKL